jgi:hypothetical protein
MNYGRAVGRMYARSHFPFAQSILRVGRPTYQGLTGSVPVVLAPHSPFTEATIPRRRGSCDSTSSPPPTAAASRRRFHLPIHRGAHMVLQSEVLFQVPRSPRSIVPLAISSRCCPPLVITVTTGIPPPCLTPRRVDHIHMRNRTMVRIMFFQAISTENRIPVCYRITGYRDGRTITP